MRSCRLGVLGYLALLLTGCGGGQTKDLIVGKWEIADPSDKEKGIVVEFTKDGQFSSGGRKGTYRLVDDKTLELEFENTFLKVAERIKGSAPAPGGKLNATVKWDPPPTIKERLKIQSISKNEVVLADSHNEAKKFVRVK